MKLITASMVGGSMYSSIDFCIDNHFAGPCRMKLITAGIVGGCGDGALFEALRSLWAGIKVS